MRVYEPTVCLIASVGVGPAEDDDEVLVIELLRELELTELDCETVDKRLELDVLDINVEEEKEELEAVELKAYS